MKKSSHSHKLNRKKAVAEIYFEGQDGIPVPCSGPGKGRMNLSQAIAHFKCSEATLRKYHARSFPGEKPTHAVATDGHKDAPFGFIFADVDGKPRPRLPATLNDTVTIDGEAHFNLSQAKHKFGMSATELIGLWNDTFPWVRPTQIRFEDLNGLPVPRRAAGYKGDATLMTVDEAAEHFKASAPALRRLWERELEDGDDDMATQKRSPAPPAKLREVMNQILRTHQIAILLADQCGRDASKLADLQEQYELKSGNPRDDLAGACEKIESGIESISRAMGDLIHTLAAQGERIVVSSATNYRKRGAQ